MVRNARLVALLSWLSVSSTLAAQQPSGEKPSTSLDSAAISVSPPIARRVRLEPGAADEAAEHRIEFTATEEGRLTIWASSADLSLSLQFLDPSGRVLLSDVDALYTAHPSDPAAERILEVADVEELVVDTSGKGAEVGTGGMETKLQAARIATSSGIPVVLAAASDVAAALAGEPVGTLFHPTGKRRARKLMWLAYASKSQGELVLDAGAVRAVAERKASLLPAGIVAVRGSFHAGDPVRLVAEDGSVIARGLVNYDAEELPVMIGRSTRDLARELGPQFDREVVHRDDLVLKGRKAR